MEHRSCPLAVVSVRTQRQEEGVVVQGLAEPWQSPRTLGESGLLASSTFVETANLAGEWVLRSLQRGVSSHAHLPPPLPLARVSGSGGSDNCLEGTCSSSPVTAKPLCLFCKCTSPDDERAFLMLPASSHSCLGSLRPLIPV